MFRRLPSPLTGNLRGPRHVVKGAISACRARVARFQAAAESLVLRQWEEFLVCSGEPKCLTDIWVVQATAVYYTDW